MGSVLLLGFMIGLRHALEADHIAAVASLTSRTRSLRAAARLAVAWGLGHTLMLFAVGAVVVGLDSAVPERVALYLEFAVGVMLVWLGYDVLRRLIRERIHFHLHRHGEETHFHAHFHAGEGAHAGEGTHAGERAHRRSPHDHGHARLGPRAFVVGLVHGMAGSAALILLTLGQFESLWPAFFYMALFGLGTMLGMTVLSLAISLPLQRLSRSLTWAHNALSAATGSITLGIGAWLIYDIGFAGGLIAG
jgi:ABC-type nickel/cobalt efflux system permease component RcnA